MPILAAEYCIKDTDKIKTIVEAVKNHDKRGQGINNETKLLGPMRDYDLKCSPKSYYTRSDMYAKTNF